MLSPDTPAPSSSEVSLTEKAQRFFGTKGVATLSFNAIRDLKKADDDVMDEILDSRPMEDQRGERVYLDINDSGALAWVTVS